MRRCCCCREEDHGHHVAVPFPKAETTGMTGGTASDANVIGSVEGYLHIGDVYVDTYKATKDGVTSTIKQLDSYLKPKHDQIKSNEVRITIESPQGKQELVFSVLKSNKLVLKTVDGVVKVNIKLGSIIIILTMKNRYEATAQWTEALLHAIFNNILTDSMSKGDVFTVTVERPKGNQVDPIYVNISEIGNHRFSDDEDPYLRLHSNRTARFHPS